MATQGSITMPTLQIIIASTRPGRVGLPIAQWVYERAVAHGGFEAKAPLARRGRPRPARTRASASATTRSDTQKGARTGQIGSRDRSAGREPISQWQSLTGRVTAAMQPIHPRS